MPPRERPQTHATRPLIAWTLAFGLGIWLGDAFAPQGHWAWFGAAAATLALAWMTIFKKPALLSPILLFLSLGVLAIHPWSAFEPGPGHVLHLAGQGPKLLTAKILEDPQNLEDRTRMSVEVRRFTEQGKKIPAHGRLRLTAKPPRPELAAGQLIEFTATVREVRNFGNPGGFDYERFMAAKGIHATAWARNKPGIRVLEEAPTGQGLFSRFRLRASRFIHSRVQQPEAGILAALLVGEKHGVSREVRDIFSRAGTAHVLAISGLHMGLLAGISFFLFNLVLSQNTVLVMDGRARRLAALLALFPVLAYALVSGMSPSTQRALVMVGVFFLAAFSWRRYEAVNTLAAAALAILAVFPPALFSLSFQLSFSAVLFIILGLRALWPGLKPGADEPSSWKKFQRRVAVLFLISVFAVAGAMPLLLRSFHQVSLVSPLSNLFVTPILFGVVFFGLLSLLALAVWPALAAALLAPAAWGTGAMVWISEFFAGLPLAGVMPLYPSLLETALWWGLVFSLLCLGKKSWAGPLLIAGLAFLAADAAYWTFNRFQYSNLRVTILDVGQGSAAVVRFPFGKVMVIDAGGFSPGSNFDTGQGIVAPYLWANKIHTIDILAASHPQQDHVGGLGFLAEHFDIGEIWTNGMASELPAHQRVLEAARTKGVPVLGPGDLRKRREVHGWNVEVLHPLATDTGAGATLSDTNDRSLVIRIAQGRAGVLFPGDLHQSGEKKLVRAKGLLGRGDFVLLAPHHGSRTSSSEIFLEAVRPGWVIFTAGWKNRHGFPHEEVVERCQVHGARTLVTGTHGAVMLETNGHFMEVIPFRPVARP